MRWILSALAICSLAGAQPAPKFEVASIKPCKPVADAAPGRKGVGRGGSIDWSPGRLTLQCRTVDDLVREAYVDFASGQPRPADPQTGIPLPAASMKQLQQELKGSPSWANSERYTIVAKASGPATREAMRGPMMQRLLEDRFHLKIHREARQVPVYVLTVAKGGPMMQRSTDASCVRADPAKGPPPENTWLCGFFGTGQNGGIETHGQSMRGLCWQFSAWLDRDVLDKTGLDGAFDIHLDLNRYDVIPNLPRPDAAGDTAPVSPADPAAAVFAAVQKLGLKLESAKAATEFLVIDHIERPSED